METKLTRRGVLRGLSLGVVTSSVAACASRVIKETVVVEKSVEKVVKETVVVEKEAVAPAPKEPVTVAYSTYWGGVRADVLTEIFNQFNETHSQVKAELHSIAEKSAWLPKLLAGFAAGSVEDTFQLDRNQATQWFDEGACYDLTPYVEAEGIVLHEQYGLMGLEYWGESGRHLCYPWVLSPHPWIYNKDAFREAGLPDPWEDYGGDYGYAEWIEWSKVLTLDKNGDGKPDQYGNGGSYTDLEYILGHFLVNNGGGYADFDKYEYTIDHPQNIEAIQMVYDVVMKDGSWLPRSEAQALGAAGTTRPFLAGITAMEEYTRGLLETQELEFDFDVIWPPRRAKGDPNPKIYVSADPNSAYGKTKHPDEAWELLKYMASFEAQDVLGQTKMLSPALKQAIANPRGFLAPPPEHVAVYNDCYDGNYFNCFLHYNGQKANDAISKHMDLIFLEQETVEEGLRAAQQEAMALLEYKNKPRPLYQILASS